MIVHGTHEEKKKHDLDIMTHGSDAAKTELESTCCQLLYKATYINNVTTSKAITKNTACKLMKVTMPTTGKGHLGSTS